MYYQLRRYHEFKEKGLCPRCGKEQEHGKVLCKECNEKRRNIYHYKKKRAIKENICMICGKPNESDYLSCNQCRINHSFYNKKSYKQKKLKKEGKLN